MAESIPTSKFLNVHGNGKGNATDLRNNVKFCSMPFMVNIEVELGLHRSIELFRPTLF